jgi:hypothetical protein
MPIIKCLMMLSLLQNQKQRKRKGKGRQHLSLSLFSILWLSSRDVGLS